MPITKDEMITQFVNQGLSRDSMDAALHFAKRNNHMMSVPIDTSYANKLFEISEYQCTLCQATLNTASEGFAYGTALRGECLGGKTK